MAKVVNVEVKRRDREPIDRFIKRFLNKVKKERIIEEIQSREFYEKPSEIKAKERNRRKRVLRKLRKAKEERDNPKEKKV